MDTSAFTSRPAIKIPLSYNKKDAILYALGIGCDENQFLYEFDDKFAVFPTYPIVLPMFKGDQGTDVLSFPPELMNKPELVAPLPGVKGLLDYEKIITKVCELPTEPVALHAEAKLVGIQQKGKGAMMETEYKIMDDTGKLYYKLVSAAFFVGVKDIKDSGVVASKDIKVPQRSPDRSVEVPTDARAAKIYRLSGDYNPLHIDANNSQMMGFKEPIIHGLCSLGHATRGLLKLWCGNDPQKFKTLRLRFSSPVIPGQTLVVESWEASKTEVIFQVKVKETGKVCISNASFEMEPSANL